MYLPSKQVYTIKSPKKPSDYGHSAAKSPLLQQKVATEGIRSEKKTSPKVEKSSIAECPVKNKKRILPGKSNTSKVKGIVNTKLSPILDQVSTSKDQDLKPFWKESLNEISKQLWLPIRTDLVDLNGFPSSETQSSFVITPRAQQTTPAKNYPKTFLPSSPRDTTKKGNTIDQAYCRKIRFYPTTAHKEVLELCFRATRFIHNEVVEAVEKGENDVCLTEHIALREKYMRKNRDIPEGSSFGWLKKVPFDTRSGVYKQLASNYETNFTKLKNKEITHFKMGYKSKKSSSQVCFMNKKSLNLFKKTLFPRKVKQPFKFKTKMERWIKKHKSVLENFGDYTIKKEGRNRYFFCLPLKRKVFPMGTHGRNEVVALDPGVRTFQTFYSPCNLGGKIGDQFCSTLLPYAEKVDNLKRILTQHKGANFKRKRRNLRHRISLLISKIRNKVNDLHWKTARYLCNTFQHIIIGDFGVSKMVRNNLPNKARKISSKTVRNMLFLSHYAFKQKLIHLCNRTGTQLTPISEAYTTKTCGSCGNIKDMKGDKVYICEKCSFVLDRDYNGARNIYMRYLVNFL